MRSLVINDKGEIESASSWALRKALDASIGGLEFRDFVVRNLGYIAITEMSGSIRLQLRPKVVSAVAFGAAMYWLADCNAARIVIARHDDAAWHDEIFGDRDSAIARLIDLVASGQSQRKKDFLRRKRDLRKLPDNCPLKALLTRWSEVTGQYSKERMSRILREALSDKYFLVEGHPMAPQLVIREIGKGYPSLDPRWLSRAVGARVEDQPDYEYGRWVADAYRDALELNTPVLEDLDVLMDTPRLGRQRLTYRRIILPFELASGSTALLGSSVIDSGVDLRIEPVQKAL